MHESMELMLAALAVQLHLSGEIRLTRAGVNWFANKAIGLDYDEKHDEYVFKLVERPGAD